MPTTVTRRRQQSFTGAGPYGGALQGARRCCHQRLPSVASFDPLSGKPSSGSHNANRADRLTADHACARLPRATWWTLSRPVAGWLTANWLVWTGVEPVTARSLVWCSTSELPIDPIGLESISEHASMTARKADRARRWSNGVNHACFQVSSPGIEPGPQPSQGRVLIRHTPRTNKRTK
jgi:hypothetical protein